MRSVVAFARVANFHARQASTTNESEHDVTTATSDPFAGPTSEPQEALSKGGGDFIPLSAFGKQGRLVLIIPLELERNVKSKFPDEKTGEEKFGPQLVADFALLTGEGEFAWPGKDEQGNPITRRLSTELEAGKTAAVFENVYVYSAPLIDKTEDARRTDLASTMTIGRLDMPKAYALTSASDKDAGIARTWLATPAGQAFKVKAQAAHDARVAAASGGAGPKEASPFG